MFGGGGGLLTTAWASESFIGTGIMQEYINTIMVRSPNIITNAIFSAFILK